MGLKTKLNSLKKVFQERRSIVKDSDFDDFTRLYKRVLKRIPDISHLKNIVLFSGLSTLIIFILFTQRFASLNEYLPTRPITGGIYTEGVEGEIAQLNPLYSPINNAETSVTSLIFSGLTKRADERKIEPDLAESWEISNGGKTYTFHLKKDIKWHDGVPLTAEDVVFTFGTIQNPDTESPYLASWKGVEVVSTDRDTVIFNLPNSYVYFLNQTNVPIIPKHLLADIPSSQLKSSKYSKAPIGSGPYVFKEFRELKNRQEVVMDVSDNYYGKKPYLKQVIIKAYKNYHELVDAFKYRSIMAIERLNPDEVSADSSLPNISAYNLAVPQYDSLIFNLRSGLTKDKSLREAISLVINRQEIIDKVYDGWATPVYSAILPGFTGYDAKLKSGFDTAAAAQKLIDAGYVKNAEGKLTKDNQIASLRLVSVDSDMKRKEAELVAKSIRELGFEVSVEAYPFSGFIEDYVRTRNYDLLLISQNSGIDTDLYAYYHGNMADDPGLNLSGINTREMDKYIEEARNNQDPAVRVLRLQAVAKIIAREVPVVNICWPNYIFGASKDIKGINTMELVEPRDKYSNISDWYIRDLIEY